MTALFGQHTLHAHDHHHCTWDRDHAPAMTVAPGERLVLGCMDASGGRLTPTSTAKDIARLPQDQVNPVTGPVRVDGAQPGDILVVHIEDFAPSGLGWTANIPGFGLLADDFPDAALYHWRYDTGLSAPAAFSPSARVPLKPFPGTIGVAPAESGPHGMIPPRPVGGNLDTRDLSKGATLYLPVAVEGALFSMGDTHAAQGDGEVCGTAIETAMDVQVSLDLIKQTPIAAPQFTLPGPPTRHSDGGGYWATTGVGADLLQAARDACRAMIDRLGREQGLDPLDAYMLMSVAGDLRITEIVDQPNVVVAFYFPRSVFD